jgi:hypothetical protein
MNNRVLLIIMFLCPLLLNKSLFALNSNLSFFNKDNLWFNESFLTISAGVDSFLHYQVDVDGLLMPQGVLNKKGEFVENGLIAANLAIGGRLFNNSPLRIYLEYNRVSFKDNCVTFHPVNIKNTLPLLGVDTVYKNDFAVYQDAVGITFNYDFLLGANNNMVIPYVGLSSFIVIRKLTNINYYLHGVKSNNVFYTTESTKYLNKETLLEVEPLVGLTLFKGYVSVEYSYAMQFNKHNASYSKIKVLANIPVL